MNERDWMLMRILDCRRVDLYAEPRCLTARQKMQLALMEERRESGEPLQYILQECEFMGLRLYVDQRVLIPRPETEQLVERALERLSRKARQPIRILDLGTGSGNIAIALARSFPSAEITAVDISRDALDVAAKNAHDHRVERKIHFLCSDMSDYLRTQGAAGEKFDLIMANPPYVPTSRLEELPVDVSYEPRLALDGGIDGMTFYRAIIAYGHLVLKDHGYLLCEIGEEQRERIARIFDDHATRYAKIQFEKDLAGKDRFVEIIR